jgi:tetratricopeptide (TPR) repeat protein/GTP-binding protein EngB required for normal cell division
MRLLHRVGRFLDDVLLPDELRHALDEADACVRAGALVEAERAYETVLAARPHTARARHSLALLRERAGRPADALETVRPLRDGDPDDPAVALLVARLALATGALEEAADAARDAARALAAEGGAALAAACALRARVELARGRPDRARRELRKAVAADPDDLSLRIELLEALAEVGREQEARSVAASLATRAPHTGAAEATRIGQALLRAGASDLAEDWLVRAADGGSWRAAVALVGCWLAQAAADPDGAPALLERAENAARLATAAGGGAEALAALGDVLVARGDTAGGVDAWLAAASAYRRSGTGSAAARRLAVLACLHAPANDPERLDRAAECSSSLVPASAHASDDLARASPASQGGDGSPASATADPEALDDVAVARLAAFTARALASLARGRVDAAAAELSAAQAETSTATAPTAEPERARRPGDASTQDLASLAHAARERWRVAWVELLVSRSNWAPAADALVAIDRGALLSAQDRARVRALVRTLPRHRLWRAGHPAASRPPCAASDTSAVPEGVVALDVAAALDAAYALLARHPERHSDALAVLARERDGLDQPLLVAVLGEFNAGKSTLVNAIVGAPIAPTGVLPTTATLNLLRHGPVERVRVVGRDGTAHEGDAASLRSLLDDAAARADAIDYVEIALPNAALTRVWLLDTPGLNALDPAHERLARRAAARADVVLWVFSARQAGKDTEATWLRPLLAEGRPVVAVLNQADRLGENEREAVVSALLEALPELAACGLGAAVPLVVSARDGLEARLRGDEEAVARSGLGAVLALFDGPLTRRADELKRRAVVSRLRTTLDESLRRERAHATGLAARARAFAECRAAVPVLHASLDADADAVLEDLAIALGRAAEQAAVEVLASWRPRRGRFALRGIDREDRAFLAEMLADRVEGAIADAAARLAEAWAVRLRGAWATLAGAFAVGAAPAPAVEAPLADAMARAKAEAALARLAGEQRGLLVGGALDRFFADVLPRAEPTQEALRPGLVAATVDAGATARPALRAAAASLVALVREAIDGAEREARAAQARHADGTLEPLEALRAAIDLDGGGPGRAV